MNLQEFLKDQHAKQSTIRGDHPHLKLKISDQGKDRFESAVAVFEDEPKVLYVLRWKMSGLNFVSHKDVLGNHNNLHSNFKKAYENLLDQLKANNIDFELNSESY